MGGGTGTKARNKSAGGNVKSGGKKTAPKQKKRGGETGGGPRKTMIREGLPWEPKNRNSLGVKKPKEKKTLGHRQSPPRDTGKVWVA